jgi:hypothetical protein
VALAGKGALVIWFALGYYLGRCLWAGGYVEGYKDAVLESWPASAPPGWDNPHTGKPFGGE